METKFKINDEVFFMKYGEPRKDTVKGVAEIKGVFGDLTEKKDIMPNSFIFYSFDKYTVLPQSDIFSSKEELQDFLFKNL